MESLRLQGQRWKSALPLLSSSRTSLHGTDLCSPFESLVGSLRKNGAVFLSSLSVADDARCGGGGGPPPYCYSPQRPPAVVVHGAAVTTGYHQAQQQSASSPTSSSFESCDGDLGFDSDNDDTMEGGAVLTVRDVADVLKGKHVILTGGRTCEGYPVLTFPDSGAFCSLSDEDYRRLMQYLTSVPLPQDAELGFVLVVDRRKDKWNSVKTVLLKISGYFPGVIQVVFVLKPVGFLQKALSEVSNKLFKEEFKFRLVMCNNLEELHEYIDPGQLTEDLGGLIPYDHERWMEQRMAVEMFTGSLKEVTECVREATQRLRDTELPNDVGSTVELLRAQGGQYQELKEDLLNASQHGHQLLRCVRPPSPAPADRALGAPGSSSATTQRLVNVCAVERLLQQLHSAEHGFDAFWSAHQKRLNECLELRKFEQEFRELQTNMAANARELADMEAVGDSVAQVDSLLHEMDEFRALAEEDLEKAEQLRQTGRELIMAGHYAVDSIEPKCVELERMCADFQEKLRQRMDVLQRYRDLQERIDKANKWCSQGVELLATLDIERCSSPEFARAALQDLDTFLNSSSEFKLGDPREFHRFFKDFINSESKPLLQQVLKRVDDVKLMCENKQASLRKLVARQVRPVQAVAPEPSAVQDSLAYDAEARLYPSKKAAPKHVEVCFAQNEGVDSGLQSLEILQDKKGHVMTELIETEKTYVHELYSIIQGYKKEMTNPEMKHLVPHSLYGKADILFGNMEALYQFHNDVFLQDLQNCRSTPELVGTCFVQRKETFHKLYSAYCMNKPKSEALRLECASDNAFFKECQRKLNHKLPLDAYLLKPVQRITKYQLLLKDLLKYSEGSGEQYQLQEAVNTMLDVLKHVNDSMHQVSITGFHGSLADYGKLLLQGMFNVWMEKKKKERMRELRFKPSQRYIFLYEHLVLFTKKYGRDDNPSYAFKNALKTSQIGLTENFKGSRGDKRKFEVWLHGRTQVFIIQAPSAECKDLWVKNIKQVLLQQFELLKDESKRQHYEKYEQLNGVKPQSPSGRARHTISGMSWESRRVADNNNHSRSECQRASRVLGRRATFPALRSYGANGELSDHEDGWSTDDLSQSEDDDDDGDIFVNTEVGGSYVALGDYEAVDVGEASLVEGQPVQVLRVGCAGWWYVRCLGGGGREGWVPAAYLGPSGRVHHTARSSPSVSSQDSGTGGLHHAISRISMASNLSSTSLDGGM
ncbi:guanine nucleotide exchange factor DBS-like isoform X1 [Dermacentor andersoni]|uniref:guanine nucleotide exchange factor DBS-like isoform X1 n=1 Tax=Dermacentor andersoni TaxID=34620 RepID=UPI002155CFF4|nr:guanine nucleotide exchange factor DBS-like isoform X1 [Dermacentor andersoni]